RLLSGAERTTVKRQSLPVQDITMNSQPTERFVKQEHEDHIIAQVHERKKTVERQRKRVICIAGEKQERIEFLEKLVDTKPEVVKKMKQSMEELEKKLTNVTEQLAEERRKREEAEERSLVGAEKEKEDLRKRLNEMETMAEQ
ncbi:hypothetical protein PMAYCL1PPCAC_04003, partial [Pristionchus mayeri]